VLIGLAGLVDVGEQLIRPCRCAGVAAEAVSTDPAVACLSAPTTRMPFTVR
jgi:hypothetical protein